MHTQHSGTGAQTTLAKTPPADYQGKDLLGTGGHPLVADNQPIIP